MLCHTLALLALAGSAFAQSVSTRPDGQVIVISGPTSASAYVPPVVTSVVTSAASAPSSVASAASSVASALSSAASLPSTAGPIRSSVASAASSVASVASSIASTHTTSAPPAYTGPMFTGAAGANKPVAALLAGAIAAVAMV